MIKNIVLLSDGTGNGSASPFKTNVWRLYQALDIAQPSDETVPRQIAYYDNGVGYREPQADRRARRGVRHRRLEERQRHLHLRLPQLSARGPYLRLRI